MALSGSLASLDSTDECRVPTPREIAVLQTYVECGSYEGVARALGVSWHTVNSHLAAVRQCLRARDTAHAAWLAYSRGLIH